jgi:N-acylneuraminate cytidylyltransferase
MIAGQRVLAVIPARGGSKGVPGKNIRNVAGKPLVAWTIEAARGAKTVDRVILSSDDRAIIEAAERFGCEAPFVRAAHLADDKTPTIEVVLDALERCPGYEWVVLLQPTSPLRTALDIDRALERCVALEAPACVSVCLAQESPYWMYTLQGDSRLAPLMTAPPATRRQELPSVYSLNGAVYVARSEWLAREKRFVTRETVAYEMPVERSLDIDTESDLVQLLTLLGKARDVSLSSSP